MKIGVLKYGIIIGIIALIIFTYTKSQEEEIDENIVSTGEVTAVQTIDEIRIGIAQFDTMNPIYSNNLNIQQICKIIYEPLVEITSDYQLEGILAEEIVKQNTTEYIIKLKENVKWTSGDRFTANDVIFTFEKVKEGSSIYSSNLEKVASFEKVDDYTVKITLTEEVPFFEYNLNIPIMSKEYYNDKDFSDTSIVPVTTGRYMVNTAESNEITLVKNTNWWNRDVELTLNTININVYDTIGELYNSFKLGNIDVISSDNTNLEEYIGSIGYTLKETVGRQHDFIAINTTDEILSNENIRYSIANIIDKQSLVASVYENDYTVTNFPLDYGSYLYDSSNETAVLSKDNAKQILTTDGWTYGYGYWYKYENYTTTKLEFNLLVNSSNTNLVTVAQKIEEQLEAEGILITIESVDSTTYYSRLSTRDYDMALCSMNLSIKPDLEMFFGDSNLAGYSNTEVDTLLSELYNTSDKERMKEIYIELSNIYITKAPYISLYNSIHNTAYSNYLVGQFSPNWYSPYYNINSWYK